MRYALRQILPVTFAEASNIQPVRAASGFPSGTRAIYISTEVSGGNEDPVSGWITFRLAGTRRGAAYKRTFSVRVGELVTLDATGLENASVDVIGVGVLCTVVISHSTEPPNAARREVFVRWQSIADGGGNTVLQVPDGALSIIPAADFAGWEWVAYDPTNTLGSVAQALTTGTEVAVSSNLFRPGAAATGGILWKVEL